MTLYFAKCIVQLKLHGNQRQKMETEEKCEKQTEKKIKMKKLARIAKRKKERHLYSIEEMK